MREEWELTTAMRRTGLRNLRGSKPKWKWDAQHGKLIRREGSGIDWYRYQQLILISKLFPFVEECRQNGRPETIVQEDGAASHASKHQWRIQSWIERILRHIQEVIRLEGDNNYREGAEI